jgi:DNA recombination protein RmuC
MPTAFIFGLLFGLPLGLSAGALITWLVVTSRERAARATALAAEESRTAAAEALVEETRKQLQWAQGEVKTARDNLRKSEAAWTVARTRLEDAEKHLQEQRNLVEKAKLNLSDAFGSLAAQALSLNNKTFLALAEEKFKALRGEATADLEARRVAIEGMVKPVGDALTAYQNETRELEEKRLKESGAVSEQLRAVAETQSALQRETAKLVSALKSPNVRGRWGEIALRKTAELAGMSRYCDFVEQETSDLEGSRLRPDMIVKLPAERDVVVDSKVPLGGFLEALEAQTDAERALALEKHAKQVGQHVAKLSSREYWGQFPAAPEFVVLFIPNDSFLAAAAEKDPDLLESALARKIVIATPTTFVALLRAIEFGWRQRLAVENAEHIRNLGQELSDRFATLVEHLTKLGRVLGNAVECHNAAIASFEGRILPMARRFRELGAKGRKVIGELQPITSSLRVVAALEVEDDGQFQGSAPFDPPKKG